MSEFDTFQNRTEQVHTDNARNNDVINSRSKGMDKEQAKWLPHTVLIVVIIFIVILGMISASLENEDKPVLATSRMPSKERIRENTKVKLSGGPSVVNAIIWSDEGKPSIFFNGEIYHEGNIIDGFRVRKILPDRVEFEKNDKIWIQHFP